MTATGHTGRQTDDARPARRRIVTHSLVVRLTHWVNAYAMGCMIGSGWGIYNASPLFPFRFPAWATLGGWLGGSIAWHLAAMWLLVGNGLLYLAYGLVSRHFRRQFLPLRPREIFRDLAAATRLRLHHEPGRYNAVQRLSYIVVLALGVLAAVSGLLLWKPVQLQALSSPLGGYEVMRRVHFLAMTGIASFILIHLVLVCLVPRTLPGMVTGRARVDGTEVSP